MSGGIVRFLQRYKRLFHLQPLIFHRLPECIIFCNEGSVAALLQMLIVAVLVVHLVVAAGHDIALHLLHIGIDNLHAFRSVDMREVPVLPRKFSPGLPVEFGIEDPVHRYEGLVGGQVLLQLGEQQVNVDAVELIGNIGLVPEHRTPVPHMEYDIDRIPYSGRLSEGI